MLRRLDGVEGIPRLLPEAPDGMLAFADGPLQPLSALPSPWEAGPLLAVRCPEPGGP
jgi:hypothetical protein